MTSAQGEPDPEAILDLWFGDASYDPAKARAREALWFASAETDALIRQRFAATIEAAARGDLASWTDAPRSALALVVLLDQFTRNVGRGTARAFAHDAQAFETARQAVASGHFARLSPVEQSFLILPYEHSESLEHQRESVRLYADVAQAAPVVWRPLLEYYLEFAKQHLALIERFGRFPHRNRVLGRESTPAERAYLTGGGATFGQ